MQQFIWTRHPIAEKWIESHLEAIVKRDKALQRFSEDLGHYTSTRLLDWLSHITLPFTDQRVIEIENLGFEKQIERDAYRLYRNPGAQFPRICLHHQGKEGVSVVVDEISNFFMAHHLSNRIEGTLYSPFRVGFVTDHFEVVERRGTIEIEPIEEPAGAVNSYLLAKELWRKRPRANDPTLSQAIDLAKELSRRLGQDRAASLVLEVEREYWQSRNMAGVLQKGRQDRLGLGWSNHDHHTFRSSRGVFRNLIELFEVLGFSCRERFYAGEEAGWGAQVMENHKAPGVLFLDVDLDPHEISLDYEWTDLKERDTLGTVGLWCALHGDSILEGGMHHLEAQFEFDELKKDLGVLSVNMMKPFSDFSYLKQAFTEGERWKVSDARIASLKQRGLINDKQAEKFLKEGAIGSHMENLQRREGYKGFNQKNVSSIIKQTDPRTI